MRLGASALADGLEFQAYAALIGICANPAPDDGETPMPTYVCYTAADRLTAEQRSRIATAITTAHSEEALAPRYLVQVMFQEFGPSRNYIGGAPVPSRQFWVRGDIRSGRTDAQRTRLQLRIAREVGEIAGSSPSDMWVYINELLPVNMVEFGHVLPQPGHENEWLGQLPKDLREHLTKLENS